MGDDAATRRSICSSTATRWWRRRRWIHHYYWGCQRQQGVPIGLGRRNPMRSLPHRCLSRLFTQSLLIQKLNHHLCVWHDCLPAWNEQWSCMLWIHSIKLKPTGVQREHRLKTAHKMMTKQYVYAMMLILDCTLRTPIDPEDVHSSSWYVYWQFPGLRFGMMRRPIRFIQIRKYTLYKGWFDSDCRDVPFWSVRLTCGFPESTSTE